MNRSNHHPERDDEELDRLLDNYWDRLNANSVPNPVPDRDLDPELTEMIHHLQSHDDAQGPTASFMRRLREDLTMATVDPISLSPRSSPGAPPASTPAPRTRSTSHQRQTRWRPALELMAAAMLIFALIGGYFGADRPFFGVSSLWQSDQSSEPEGMLYGNAARTGEMAGPGPDGQPGLRWRINGFSNAQGIFTAPIVAGDTIYTTGQRQDRGSVITITSLSAIDLNTGKTRWSVDLDGMDAGTPSVANGLVYIGVRFYAVPGANLATPAPYPTSPGALIAFDATTGVEQWRHTMAATEAYSPVVANGSVYVNSMDGSISALDGRTGAVRWRTPLGNFDGFGSPASPAVADGIVYTANNDGVLYALNADSGDVKWVAPTKGNLLQTPVISDGVVYAAASLVSEDERASQQQGWLAAFNASDGKALWTRDIGSQPYSSVAVANGHVFLAAGVDRPSFVAYDAATGNIAWTLSDAGNAAFSPSVAGDTIYTGSNANNRLYALDATTGQERWAVELSGSVVGPPAVIDGMVIASTRDGRLYAIGGSAVALGTPIATPIPGGDASGLPECTITPHAPWSELDLSGTPAKSLLPVTDAQRHGQPAAAKPGDLPAGQPADGATVAEIQDMLTQAHVCSQRGLDRAAAAFVSDDFLRRPWVNATLDMNYERSGYTLVSDILANVALDEVTADATRVLPDGRIGVFVPYPATNAGQFLVFVNQDGHWLLDEWIEVRDNPDAMG
jgi:outer membrane protein assembly factor BamB